MCSGAIDKPEEERAAFLDDAGAGRPELREKVDALLRSHEATGFMESGPHGGGFPPAFAHEAMAGIQRAYAVQALGNLAQLNIHPNGHVFEVANGCKFIEGNLETAKPAASE